MADSAKVLVVDGEISLIPTHRVDPGTVFGLVRDNLSELARWMVWATPGYSLSAAEAFIEQTSADWGAGSRRNYMIEYQKRVCGNLGMFGLQSPAGDFEIGYWLDAQAQGRGVMTRACNALVDTAFTDLGAELVQLKAATENAKSRAVAIRLGMTEEGTLRRRSRNAHGELLDLVVYSITASEWRSANTA